MVRVDLKSDNQPGRQCGPEGKDVVAYRDSLSHGEPSPTPD